MRTTCVKSVHKFRLYSHADHLTVKIYYLEFTTLFLNLNFQKKYCYYLVFKKYFSVSKSICPPPSLPNQLHASFKYYHFLILIVMLLHVNFYAIYFLLLLFINHIYCDFEPYTHWLYISSNQQSIKFEIHHLWLLLWPYFNIQFTDNQVYVYLYYLFH